MTTQLVVKIVLDNGRKMAVTTTDNMRCFIDEPPADLNVGDRWFAVASAGRMSGGRGHSRVRLTIREAQGLLPEIQGHWVDPESLHLIQTLLGGGIHILLEGPSGAGKTVLGVRLGEARGWVVHSVDCAQILNSRELFGADAAGGGSTRFVPSATTSWLREMASKPEMVGLLLLDELSRGERTALNGLLNLTGPLRRTSVPSVDGTQEIALPSNVRVVATANLGREFVGTQSLDVALSDRFFPVHIDRAPLDATVALLRRDKRWKDVSDEDIRYLVSAVDTWHTQYQGKATLRTPPSFRRLEAALILKASGWSREKCLKDGLLRSIKGVERDNLMAAISVKVAPPSGSTGGK